MKAALLPASLEPYQFEISPALLSSAVNFVIGGYDQIKVVSTALDEALRVLGLHLLFGSVAVKLALMQIHTDEAASAKVRDALQVPLVAAHALRTLAAELLADG